MDPFDLGTPLSTASFYHDPTSSPPGRPASSAVSQDQPRALQDEVNSNSRLRLPAPRSPLKSVSNVYRPLPSTSGPTAHRKQHSDYLPHPHSPLPIHNTAPQNDNSDWHEGPAGPSGGFAGRRPSCEGTPTLGAVSHRWRRDDSASETEVEEEEEERVGLKPMCSAKRVKSRTASSRKRRMVSRTGSLDDLAARKGKDADEMMEVVGKPLTERPTLALSPRQPPSSLQSDNSRQQDPSIAVDHVPLHDVRINGLQIAKVKALRGPSFPQRHLPGVPGYCAGARLIFEDGAEVIENYDWTLHKPGEAWKVEPADGKVYIRSLECDGVRAAGEKACRSCVALLRNRNVLKMTGRDRSVTAKGVRLDKRTLSQLIAVIRAFQEKERIKFLKHKNLTRSWDRATGRNIILHELLQLVSDTPAKSRASAIMKAALAAGRGHAFIGRQLLRAKAGKLKLADWSAEEVAASLVVDIVGKHRATSAVQQLGGPG
ncbi:hypothetical protein P7C70_g3672, partial [Phenoliferia sp. Uapishka_3]